MISHTQMYIAWMCLHACAQAQTDLLNKPRCLDIKRLGKKSKEK